MKEIIAKLEAANFTTSEAFTLVNEVITSILIENGYDEDEIYTAVDEARDAGLELTTFADEKLARDHALASLGMNVYAKRKGLSAYAYGIEINGYAQRTPAVKVQAVEVAREAELSDLELEAEKALLTLEDALHTLEALQRRIAAHPEYDPEGTSIRNAKARISVVDEQLRALRVHVENSALNRQIFNLRGYVAETGLGAL